MDNKKMTPEEHAEAFLQYHRRRQLQKEKKKKEVYGGYINGISRNSRRKKQLKGLNKSLKPFSEV